MGTCEHCAQRLVECPHCNGQAGTYSIAGQLRCTHCDNTGSICATHGRQCTAVTASGAHDPPSRRRSAQ